MDDFSLYTSFKQTLCDGGGLKPGGRLLVAVSGGADSMALLHLCLEAAAEFGFEVCVAHFDHAMRDDSAADAAFVSRHCDELGVRVTVERGEVGRRAREVGIGLEEAGRNMRYAFLERNAAALGCQRVALGHHRQDQAETVLHRLARGTGMAGLAAMRVRRGLFVRPLLFCSRDALRGFLASREIEYREDSSNDDDRYTRNFLRHRVVPTLRQLNPRFDEALAHLAEVAAAEEDYWSERVKEKCGVLQHPQGGWLIPGLLELHTAELRRVLLYLLQAGVTGQVGYAHVVAVEKMIHADVPQAEVSLPGGRAVRRFERLELQRGMVESLQPWEFEVTAPGRYDLPDGGRLILGEETGDVSESTWSVVFPCAALKFPLSLRAFCPGDRIALADGLGHKKLKKIYGEKHLEREVRERLPLLVMGGEVLWIPGLRRSGKYRCEQGAERAVRITLEKPESIESLLVKSGCLC